jgi:hypothetical protein
MPATFQGTTTVPSTTPWAASTAYTASSSYVQPTPATGQYFLCTVSGTSGGSQPAWSTGASLPVPGQTFTDGGATWTCMGAIIAAPTNIVVDTPLDTDPNLVAPLVRGLKSLANNLAWFNKNAALLANDNVWTGTNDFQAGISVEEDATLTNGSGVVFTGTYGTPGNVPLFFATSPGSATRLCLFQALVGSGIYARIYADSGASLNSLVALTLTINASWNSGSWTQDQTGSDASLYYFGNDNLAAYTWPAGTSFSSATVLLNAGLSSAAQALVLAMPISLAGKVQKVTNSTTAGSYGVNATLSELALNSVVANTPWSLAFTTPATNGFFRLECYVEITSGSATPVVDASWTAADATTITMGLVNMTQLNTGSGASGHPLYTFATVVWAKGATTITFSGDVISSNYNVAATITAIA